MNKKYKMYQKPNVFQRNYSFSGIIDAKTFWVELGTRVISFLCASILLCIALAVLIPGTTEQIIAIADIAVPVLAVLWFSPVIALSRRRLRDAGYSAKSYLWLLLPVLGWIIFLARLCRESK